MKLDDSTRKYVLFFSLVIIFIFYITIFRNYYYEGLGNKFKDKLKQQNDETYNKKLADEKRKIITDNIKKMDDEQLHQIIKTIEQIKRDF